MAKGLVSGGNGFCPKNPQKSLCVYNRFPIDSGAQGVLRLCGRRIGNRLDFHFTISAPATIYVCLTEGLQPTTPLLTGFTDTGDDILSSDVSYNIYSKSYPAGLVSLGPNPGTQSMYWVMMSQ